jgi:hypothetical protein
MMLLLVKNMTTNYEIKHTMTNQKISHNVIYLIYCLH